MKWIIMFILAVNTISDAPNIKKYLLEKKIEGAKIDKVIEFGMGDGNNQIGFKPEWYPGGFVIYFTVDIDSNIYIADMVNSKIKKFNSKGELLLCFDNNGHNEIDLRGIYSLIVDQKENIYIVTGTATSSIHKFNSNGKYLLTFGDKRKKIDYTWLSVDNEGNIYVNVYDRTISSDGEYYICKFDQNGNKLIVFEKVKLIDSYCITESGYLFQVRSSRVDIFTLTGEKIKTIKFPKYTGIMRSSGPAKDIYFLVQIREIVKRFDGKEYMNQGLEYIPEPKVEKVFDHKGKYLGTIRKIAYGAGIVGGDGNFYVVTPDYQNKRFIMVIRKYIDK